MYLLMRDTGVRNGGNLLKSILLVIMKKFVTNFQDQFLNDKNSCFAPYQKCVHRIGQNPKRIPRYRKDKQYTVAAYKVCISKNNNSSPSLSLHLANHHLFCTSQFPMQCASPNSKPEFVAAYSAIMLFPHFVGFNPLSGRVYRSRPKPRPDLCRSKYRTVLHSYYLGIAPT